MARRLHKASAEFSTAFASLLLAREAVGGDVRETVAGIVQQIQKQGDEALVELSRKFDRVNLVRGDLQLSDAVRAEHAAKALSNVRRALEHAAERIRVFHETQKPQDKSYTDADGVELGVRWQPVDAAGLYVPGGKAAYPSSVLMNAIPAKVAGVGRIVMVVPTPDGEINPAVMAAAEIAGVDEVYPVGGAQAVAALAYGTESIQPVDVVVGPGNAYVAEAKRQVFGTVGIDMIAGPSEILVVADATNNPRWIAADLLSQAEHDPLAQAVLITDDSAFADAVEAEIQDILKTLPRREIAGESWEKHGAVIVVEKMEDAVKLVNRIAPEHLELAMDNAEDFARRIRHAGAIFLGRHTPEAIGDYVAGPSHVLPTSRTARFASALTVSDFMKRTSLIGCSPESFARIAATGEALAQAEGLHAHALSLSVRREKRGRP